MVLRNGKQEEESGWTLPWDDFICFIDSLEIDYIASAPLLPSRCGFLFMSLGVEDLFW